MELELNGVLSSEQYTSEQIEDMFLDWCEENNISFGGAFYEGDDKVDNLFDEDNMPKVKNANVNQ